MKKERYNRKYKHYAHAQSLTIPERQTMKLIYVQTVYFTTHVVL